MPAFSDDDVLDFFVTEALVQRGQAETNQANRDRKSREMVAAHKQNAQAAGLVPRTGGRA